MPLQASGEESVHLPLALKHFQSVQTIDTQQLEGGANLDLFAKFQAEVYTCQYQ